MPKGPPIVCILGFVISRTKQILYIGSPLRGVSGCTGFYLPIKYSFFHPEADQITYKELEGDVKVMGFGGQVFYFLSLVTHVTSYLIMVNI